MCATSKQPWTARTNTLANDNKNVNNVHTHESMEILQWDVMYTRETPRNAKLIVISVKSGISLI